MRIDKLIYKLNENSRLMRLIELSAALLITHYIAILRIVRGETFMNLFYNSGV